MNYILIYSYKKIPTKIKSKVTLNNIDNIIFNYIYKLGFYHGKNMFLPDRLLPVITIGSNNLWNTDMYII